jgi:surface antigen
MNRLLSTYMTPAALYAVVVEGHREVVQTLVIAGADGNTHGGNYGNADGNLRIVHSSSDVYGPPC